MAQAWTLLLVATRELLVGLPASAREMRRWRGRAQAAPEAAIREDALNVQRYKRTHVDGAAMFSTLLPGHRPRLQRLLIAYELMLDYLDYASERGQRLEEDYEAGERDGQQLHAALLNALDDRTELVKHYARHPWADDAGYLRTLIFACRAGTSALPSYRWAQALATEEAERAAEVLAANHIPDERLRDARLKAWAVRRFPDGEMVWFEAAAAVSGSLAIHGLLAQAEDVRVSPEQIGAAHYVYLRWVALATAMMDSHADRLEDAAADGHSYVSHYDQETMQTELSVLVKETLRAASRLPHGPRHAILSAAMIAMYLSKDDARSPELSAETRALASAGGPLVRCLLPALRAWRVFFSHQSA